MSWDLNETVRWYSRQGATSDQQTMITLLREVQAHFGGSIPLWVPEVIAEQLGVKSTLILALIRRIPSLRLGEGHLLEICAGPNCGKHKELLALAEMLTNGRRDVTLKTVPCQRLCGKGPNIRFDGELHHKADETLLRRLLKNE